MAQAGVSVNKIRIIEALLIAGVTATATAYTSTKLNSAALDELRVTMARIEARGERTGDEVEELTVSVAVAQARMAVVVEDIDAAETARRGMNDWSRSLRDRIIDHERKPHNGAQ